MTIEQELSEQAKQTVDAVKDYDSKDPIRYQVGVAVVGKFLELALLVKDGLPDDNRLHDLLTQARETYLHLVDAACPRFSFD